MAITKLKHYILTMNKRWLHHRRQQIKHLNYWIFLGIFLISGAIAVYSLRQNNLTMIRLRDVVYVADKENGDIETALKNLRQHIHSHMNTNPASGNNAIKPPIQLKYRYERLVAAEKAKTPEQIYTDAQNYCESQNTSVSGRSRVPCIEAYVSSHSAQNIQIDDSLYKFDFVSPRWSADVAGISLLVSVISLILFVVLFTLDKWAAWELKRHQ